MQIFRIFRVLRLIGITFVCLGLGVYGLISGTRKKNSYAVYKAPITLSYDEFIRRHPSSGWYRITGCTTDLTESIYQTIKFSDDSDSDKDKKYTDTGDSTGSIDEVYVPTHRDRLDETPSHLVLITKEEGVRQLLHQAEAMGFTGSAGELKDSDDASSSSDTNGDSDSSKKDSEPTSPEDKKKLEQWLRKNIDRLVTTRTVEGMVSSADDLDSDQKKSFDMMPPAILAPGYIVLQEGVTPDNNSTNFEIGLASVFLFVGTICGLLLLVQIGALVGGKGKSVPVAKNEWVTHNTYAPPAPTPTQTFGTPPAPAPPTSDGTAPTYTVRDPYGREYGPADARTVVSWMKEGRLPLDALARDIRTGASVPIWTLELQIDGEHR